MTARVIGSPIRVRGTRTAGTLTRAGVVAGLALLFTGSLAEAQLTRGALAGTITDTSGGALPGATVTVTSQATNIPRTTVTNEVGVYRIPALEPGLYAARVELSGFRTVENRDVEISPAQEATFNVQLAVGGVAETVDVTADVTALALNRTNPTVGQTFDERQARELPLSSTRDLNNLVLLTPTATRAPGSTEISVAGQRARNNNFMIDGSDNNDISVTLRTVSLPPEAVAQFQVIVNPYNAEFGRSTGGQVNAITKAGSNQARGQGWEVYRSDKLQSRTNLERSAGLDSPPDFSGHAFGFSLGGPIRQNRTFAFGLYSGDRRERNPVDQTTRIPTPAGLAALRTAPLRAGQSAASRQTMLDLLGFLNDVHAQSPAYRDQQNVIVNGVAVETANVNLPREWPLEQNFVMFRVDHQLSSNSTLTGRYIRDPQFTTNHVSNRRFGSLFAGNQDVLDQNLAISETRVLNASTLNEFRFGYIGRRLDFPENDPTSPTVTIGGLTVIGGESAFPQGRDQHSFQFFDIVSLQRGRHAIRAGADIRYIRLDNRADFDIKGTFGFNNLQDFMNNVASTYTQALQTASFESRQWQQFYFVQDDIRLSPNVTVNLGLRYELNSVPFGFFGATDPAVQAARVPGPTRVDRNNFAPRLGFAWTPTPQGGTMRSLLGDARSVIRGGFGVGYDVLFYNILTVNMSNYPRVNTLNFQNQIDRYPQLETAGPAPTFNPLAQFVNTPEDAQHPATRFWNVSLQREAGRDLLLEVGYQGNVGRNGINQLQANPSVLTEAQAATVRATGNFLSIPSVQLRREDPAIGSRVLIGTSAKSEYHAGYVSLQKRLSRGLQAGVSYTLSRLWSDNDESLGVADIVNSSPQTPQDFRDIDAEWSRSAFDRPHRFAFHFVYEVPAPTDQAVVRHVLGGWQVAGIWQAQSGQPMTIFTGVDSNGNGTAAGDRPNFDASGTLTPDPDTGNLRTFTTDGMFIVPRGANGLPLQNGLGNGNLGRNTLRGPGFQDWNLSLSKRFAVHGEHQASLRLDAINAFNQPNYKNPVTNMNSANFGRNIQDWGRREFTISLGYEF